MAVAKNKEKKSTVVTVQNTEEEQNAGRGSSIVPKILSILAAIALWFYVIDVQTTQFEKTFYGVAVTLENFDTSQGLDIISGRNGTVDVVIKGTKAQVNALGETDIKASADMSGVNESGDYRLNVSVTVPSGLTVVEKSIGYVEVSVDKTVGKTVPLKLEMTYTLPDSYEFDEISMSPKNIYVSGPQDLVDSVEQGRVSLDLGTVSGKVTAKCSVTLVDVNDNIVQSPYLRMNESTVDVTVPVLKSEQKRVNVNIADTDLEYDIDVSPKNVIIKGEAKLVDSIDSVSTDVLEIVKSSVTSLRLSLPNEVTAYDENGNIISAVTVTVSNVRNAADNAENN